MILGIGTDIVKISRFNSWLNFSQENLLHVFTEQEIQDFSQKSKLNNNFNLQILAKNLEAKEACYKALSAALVKLNLNTKDFYLLFACKNIEVIKGEWGVPMLNINYKAFEDKLGIKLPNLNIDLSISHEKDFAQAFVIISK